MSNVSLVRVYHKYRQTNDVMINGIRNEIRRQKIDPMPYRKKQVKHERGNEILGRIARSSVFDLYLLKNYFSSLRCSVERN